MRPLNAAAVTFLASCIAAGCGGGAPPAKSTAPAKTAAPETSSGATTSTRAPGLRRAQVKQAIAQGLGVFLQNVSVDDYPVMKDGRFYGFRVRAINPDWGVELRPGDVVTRVNGMPIEHPEEADAAMRSLEKASAVRVDYERDGAGKTLEVPIVD